MSRCPHCGHTPGEGSFMAMKTDKTDWRLVFYTALFVAAVILVLAGVHDGVLGR